VSEDKPVAAKSHEPCAFGCGEVIKFHTGQLNRGEHLSGWRVVTGCCEQHCSLRYDGQLAGFGEKDLFDPRRHRNGFVELCGGRMLIRQLEECERITQRLPEDPRLNGRAQRRCLRIEQRRSFLRIKRWQRHDLTEPIFAARALSNGTGGGEDECTRSRQAMRQEGNDVGAGRIQPVHVLDEDEEGSCLSRFLDKPENGEPEQQLIDPFSLLDPEDDMQSRTLSRGQCRNAAEYRTE